MDLKEVIQGRSRWVWILPAAAFFAAVAYVEKRWFSVTLQAYGYETAGFILLMLAFALLFRKKYVRHIRPLYFIFFLPVWIMPLIRCWYRIPYVFCDMCPGRCGWGMFRQLFVPGYVGLNLDRRFWCFNLCPIGQIQDCMPKKKTINVSKIGRYTRYPILAFVILAVFLNYPATDAGWGHTMLELPGYQPSILGLGLLALVIVGSAFICRPFCNLICPIGAVGDEGIRCLECKKKT